MNDMMSTSPTLMGRMRMNNITPLSPTQQQHQQHQQQQQLQVSMQQHLHYRHFYNPPHHATTHGMTSFSSPLSPTSAQQQQHHQQLQQQLQSLQNSQLNHHSSNTGGSHNHSHHHHHHHHHHSSNHIHTSHSNTPNNSVSPTTPSSTPAPPTINAAAPVRKKYKPMQRYNTVNHDRTAFYGWIILFCTFIFFISSTYCLFFSKLLPDTGNKVLDFIKYDWYYCFLVPVLIPVTIITVYFNWLSLKFFRHN
ncbi:hypothetical protein CYY_004885 [Polysphondylium violaceum]|uniref:Transmembrane protein n=1 Tax=Polysphondylium violaceum TaxID=133409 RepID=A0A8J4PUN0_9MYCE|nr:hypothetical protein CYY_004885 [Polysphondylium violaceum]